MLAQEQAAWPNSASMQPARGLDPRTGQPDSALAPVLVDPSSVQELAEQTKKEPCERGARLADLQPMLNVLVITDIEDNAALPFFLGLAGFFDERIDLDRVDRPPARAFVPRPGELTSTARRSKPV